MPVLHNNIHNFAPLIPNYIYETKQEHDMPTDGERRPIRWDAETSDLRPHF